MRKSAEIRDGLFESARAVDEGRKERRRVRSRERGGGVGEINGDSACEREILDSESTVNGTMEKMCTCEIIPRIKI